MPARIDDAPRILVVATEWQSAYGGLSTFNRQLCTALAAAGAEVFCQTPPASDQEHRQAAAAGVRLVHPPATPGAAPYEDLSRPGPLPGGRPPDLVIGHDRVTGSQARRLVEDSYPYAARFHVVHTVPDQGEWLRPESLDQAAERAEQKVLVGSELARTASRVLAVGPLLVDRARLELSGYVDVPDPVRIDPGFDDPTSGPRRPPRGRPAQILILGRLDDTHLKGVDIAARAVAGALRQSGLDPAEVALLGRGVPAERARKLRARIREWAGVPTLEVTLRSFTPQVERLREDLLRASLVLMPSRAEPFGLAGAEAIVTGTPVLISNRSGLGALLAEVLPADETRRVVVPVSDQGRADGEIWGSAVAAVLRDPESAFALAGRVGSFMATERTWAMAAGVVLDALADVRPPGRARAGALGAVTAEGADTPAPMDEAAAGPTNGDGCAASRDVTAGRADGPEHARPGARGAAAPADVPAIPPWPGNRKLEFCRRLGDSWRDLADLAGIQRYETVSFPAGQEARHIWGWLQDRDQIADLPELCRRIGRPDLADALEGGRRHG